MLLRVSAFSSFEHFLRSLGLGMVVCVCVMLLAGLAPAAGGAVDQVGAGECGREEGISPRRGEGE